MNQIHHHSTSQPNQHYRIAVVNAAWHGDIVMAASAALRAELAQHGVPDSHIVDYEVPGAFEIPLRARQIIAATKPDAVVACALVVDGGIYRHEFVASAVIDGLMRVQLDTGVPVFSAVLTPQQFHEHSTHQQFFLQHMQHKGREVAKACLSTLKGMRQLAVAA
ncbi:MAG: 6,7-dimethyl-8-ribityllumazine synthase [Burkholderiales bacterium]|nr:6,7-dimethyl-8-ribityllumazine synthase [Burkholderiales bacterium]